MSVRNLVPWLLYCLFGLAAAQSACGPYRVAFYDLGLLHYRDASGMARGIDVDLIEALAERSGCRFETTLESRVRIWAQMAEGRLDITVSGIPTPEREQFAEFVPYFVTRNLLVVRRDLPPQARSPEGFLAQASLSVGVVKSFKHGAVYDAWLERLRAGGRVVTTGDFDTLVRLFQARRIDAFLTLPTSWMPKAGAAGGAAPVDLLDSSPKEALVHGLVLSRSRLPPEVRGRLRAAIDEMHRDGSLQRMLSRHVGEDLARKMLVPMP
ncbi:substrate-binding periplasmic protein [Pseudorhodoferax sp.]|uniref:substrate-binding periplasmic protein n=1 Tax=Pseudorhodoferax sp. TaxID=1993553 RepID=UPI002DD62333|nr:transporter substrate-binding domain-containing protein [Pseudorhodoferax sp.]